MSRHCRITGCPKPPGPRRHICRTHRWRLERYGNPNLATPPPPDEQDVQIVVERRQPTPGLPTAEARAVARKLTALGLSAAAIAQIVGRTPRTIHRWRATDRTTTTQEAAA